VRCDSLSRTHFKVNILMSFLSKLFGRKKSKVEERRIESEVEKVIVTDPLPKEEVISVEEALAGWVKGLKEEGAFRKDYKLVNNFIAKINPRGNGLVGGMHGVKPFEMTEEMVKFIHQYQVLGLKCSNEEFQDWITNVSV